MSSAMQAWAEELKKQGMNEQQILKYLDDIAGSLRKNIGKNVRRLRQERGITQEQLATWTGWPKKYGISVRTIARLESGESFSEETLKSIAGAFDVSMDELKMPAEPPDPEAKKLLKDLAAKEGQALVDFHRVDSAADLIRMFNAAEAMLFNYEEAETREQAEVLEALKSNITDTVDIWSEMSEVHKFETRQFLDGLLSDLKSVGYTLYMAWGHSTYFLGVDPAKRVSLEALMLMARRLNVTQFVSAIPKEASLAS